MQKKFKLGLDIHGVINKQPELFSRIASILIENNCEIHILTGSHSTDGIIKELRDYKMIWNKLFSISDYHKELGTNIKYDEKGNPWIEETLWNRTKGDYCKTNEITFHIDDTKRYGEHFQTNFLYVNLNKKDKIELPKFENINSEFEFVDYFMKIFLKYTEQNVSKK